MDLDSFHGAAKPEKLQGRGSVRRPVEEERGEPDASLPVSLYKALKGRTTPGGDVRRRRRLADTSMKAP